MAKRINKRCEHCKQYIWYSHPSHRFRVAKDNGTYETASRTCGINHVDAATAWAEETDEYEEYAIAFYGEKIEVTVWKEGEPDKPKRLKVGGEFVAEYYAEEVTKP